MEYLVLTGFTMLVLMVLLAAAYSRMAAVEKQIDIDATERAVSRIKEAADFVYVHGHPTKLRISVYIPGDVDSDHSYITNRTVNLAMRTRKNHTDVWRRTRGDIGWDLYGASQPPTSEGYYVLTVESTSYSSPHAGRIDIHQ